MKDFHFTFLKAFWMYCLQCKFHSNVASATFKYLQGVFFFYLYIPGASKIIFYLQSPYSCSILKITQIYACNSCHVGKAGYSDQNNREWQLDIFVESCTRFKYWTAGTWRYFFTWSSVESRAACLAGRSHAHQKKHLAISSQQPTIRSV